MISAAGLDYIIIQTKLIRIIKPTDIQNREVEFDLERIIKIFDKQDKRALTQYCKDFNIIKYDFTTVDDAIKK